MTTNEAFTLMNNLDLVEGTKRRLGPSHSLIQINRNGHITSVERFDHPPTEEEQVAALKRQPGCIQINGKPGLYESLDEFESRIQGSMQLFDGMKT